MLNLDTEKSNMLWTQTKNVTKNIRTYILEKLLAIITEGPSKDVLIDAFKYLYNESVQITLNFIAIARYDMTILSDPHAYISIRIEDIKLLGIEYEYHNKDSFILNGLCKKADPTIESELKLCKFEAHYNVQDRAGWISFF